MPTFSQNTGRKVFADNVGAFSVDDFCLAFGISVPMFYKMLRQGIGPDTFNCGNRRLISYAAANRWAAQREQAAKEAAAAS
jgi:hypothetical protein